MDTAILSSVIGGSAVVVATLLGVLFNRMFAFQKVTNIQLENVVNAVHGLDTKMKDLEIRLGDKFTGQLKAMGDKFTGEIKVLAKPPSPSGSLRRRGPCWRSGCGV